MRFIKQPEKDYAKGRRAIKRIEDMRKDIDTIREASWRLKNKIKGRKKKK